MRESDCHVARTKKRDWQVNNAPTPTDFNRIEGISSICRTRKKHPVRRARMKVNTHAEANNRTAFPAATI